MKSSYNGNGGTNHNGDCTPPLWLRHLPEYAEVRAYYCSSWAVGPA